MGGYIPASDLYELRMAASYLRRGMTAPATFSLFARALPPGRGFLVAAGLADCLTFLGGFGFTGDGLGYLTALAAQVRRRDELAAGLPDDVLQVYDRLKARKDGLAVVELRHGVCQGCHLELTPGELAEGREIGRLGMVRCVQCGRLLVESTGE